MFMYRTYAHNLETLVIVYVPALLWDYCRYIGDPHICSPKYLSCMYFGKLMKMLSSGIKCSNWSDLQSRCRKIKTGSVVWKMNESSCLRKPVQG